MATAYNIIGLVIMETYHHDLSLCNIRTCIKSQFDEDQLQTLGGGDSFTFMMNSIPISKNQENAITVHEVSISNDNNTHDADLFAPKLLITRSETMEHRETSHITNPSRLSVSNFRQNSHHSDSYYEGATIPSSHETAKPTTTCFSVLVRAPLNPALNRYNSNSFSTTARGTSRDDMELSMNIFNTLDHDFVEWDDCKFDTDEGGSELPTPSCNTSETSNSSRSPSPLHRQQTRLEAQFGEKLPKIGTIRSLKSKSTVNVQMTNVLARAQVVDTLQPMKIANRRAKHSDSTLLSVSDVCEDRLFDDRCRFTVVGSPLEQGAKRRQKKTWIFYNAKELVLGLPGVHHSAKAPIWVDLVCDYDTFGMISDHIRPRIHKLSIEDCVTPECREKLELFDDYLFICVHCSYTERLYAIVFKTMIITYHQEMGQTADAVITEARNQLEKRHEIKCVSSPGWVVHSILNVIVHRMIPEVECRVQEVGNVESLVFALSGSSHNELLQRMQKARTWLIVCRSRLWPKSTMTHNLMSCDWRMFLDGVQQQYWNDIHDHVSRMVDRLSSGRSTLERAQSIFVAKIGLQMTYDSNDMTDSAGHLLVVASVFLPLVFLAGLW
eukprot:271635_1